MTPFEDAHAKLVAGELARCRGDDDRKAAIIATLAQALGLALAVCAEGDGAVVDKLMIGAEAYAHAEAVEKAPFARTLAGLRR